MTERTLTGRSAQAGTGNIAKLALIGVAIFAASYLGIALIDRTGGEAPIWIANAILIYFVLKNPAGETPAIMFAGCAARFLAGIAIGSTPLSALVFTLCNFLEVFIVALPMRALGAHIDFTRPRSLACFYALAIGPAPFVPGLLAAGYVHFTRGAPLLPALLNWYAADGLGLIVIVPVLFTVRGEAFARMFRRDQVFETVLCVSTVLLAGAINRIAVDYPVAFLFFPAVLFLTFQRSFEGGAIGLILISAYLISPVLIGRPLGGLHLNSLHEQILIVEIYIAVLSFSVVLVGTALNERRKLEASLSRATERAEMAREEAIVAKDAAEKANRMKSMFLATMSHELRTPLNAVIGFSQLMEAETFGPLGDDHYRDYSSLIQKAGTHLLDLINDILDMSKIEAGKFELHRQQFDIADAVEECVILMRARADQGEVSLGFDMPAVLPCIEADPRAVKQILLNLLSNAVKFTPAGGSVTTRATAANGSLLLSVIDTGVGIPADQLYRLGNPFVQLRNNAGATHEGTGLGLALVRSLAEMHGGRLRIESVENSGTTVTVEIPLGSSTALAA